MPEPAVEDVRITRIARALCRSARIDPDSILTSGEPELAKRAGKHGPAEGAVPAWTMVRGAALTVIHRHDERIVSPL